MTKGGREEGSGAPGGFLSLTSYCPGKEIVGKGRSISGSSWGRRLAGFHAGYVALEGQNAIKNDASALICGGGARYCLFSVPQSIGT